MCLREKTKHLPNEREPKCPWLGPKQQNEAMDVTWWDKCSLAHGNLESPPPQNDIGMVVHTCKPVLESWKQEHREFQVILSYTMRLTSLGCMRPRPLKSKRKKQKEESLTSPPSGLICLPCLPAYLCTGITYLASEQTWPLSHLQTEDTKLRATRIPYCQLFTAFCSRPA